MKSKVYIVGAGPGDPSLVTKKAIELLARADCVVYDRLANPAMLDLAKPGAELIYAGKAPGRHAMEQEGINALLVRKAREGLLVVRLKGGDPFLFGRGGEEADFLAAEGVPFEVVPGISAAFGASAYAGVPLTDRRMSSSVTFVTAREGEGGSPGVDWDALARTGGTLVVYMGRAVLGEVLTRLRDAGMSADTPALAVQDATLSSQKSVRATITDLARLADERGLRPPCVTIIGAVAAHYPSLAWFEGMALLGKRVCVMRPPGAEELLAGSLTGLGADVIRLPLIEIVAAEAPVLAEGLNGLSKAGWVVFTSAHGVRTFCEALQRKELDARALYGKRIAAVGSATAKALKGFGIFPDLVPKEYTGGALLEALLEVSGEGESFLLWRGSAARPELEDGLAGAGREVSAVAAYETRMPEYIDSELLKELADEAPDAFVFSSASTVTNFVEVMGIETARSLAKRSKFVSIGPVTSAALRDNGLCVSAEAAPHTADGLLSATVSLLSEAVEGSGFQAV